MHSWGGEESHAGKSFAKCTILISLKIKPYFQAAEGIQAVLKTEDRMDTEFIFLEDVQDTGVDNKKFYHSAHQKKSIVAIGPEAVLYLNKNPVAHSLVKLFTMVSEPFFFKLQKDASFCGFFLGVDGEEQVNWIRKTLPGVQSLGVLYDQIHNRDYILKAKKAGEKYGILIKPLTIESKYEIPKKLRENWGDMDGLLLIPDATVISASMVKYIIKDGISNNVPVIGYNRFFSQSGALMSFVYDYHQIGKETANLVIQKVFEESECRSRASGFKILINQNISDHLDLKIPDAIPGITIEKNE